MSTKKIKVLKKTDKLALPLTLADRCNEWIDRYTVHLIGAVVAILLVGAGLYAYNSYSASREAKAGTEYAIAIAKWPADESTDPKKWDDIIQELQTFVEKYKGSGAALNARLDLAKAYFEVHKYEDAFKAASLVVAETPSGHSLKMFARYELALSAEALGRTDDALAQWEALKKEGMPGNVREADWHLAQIYEKKQDYAKAADTYEQALKSAGNYPEAGLIRQALESVKAKSGAKKGNS